MAWNVTSWFKEECKTYAPDIVRKCHIAYLQDSSINQYDAVGFGSPIFIDGTICPQAVQFDGADDYFAIIEMNYNSSSLDHGLTLEFYLQTDSINAWQSLLSFSYDGYYRSLIRDTDGVMELAIYAEGAQQQAFGNTRIADGTKKHCAVRYDPSVNGGQIKFFIDGASDSVVDSIGTVWGIGSPIYGLLGIDVRSPAGVFNDPDGTAKQYPFIGNMEYARIWHVARTDAEINSYHDTCSLDTTSGLQLNYIMENMGNVSQDVITWPTIRRHWSDIRPQSAPITLANDTGKYNDLFQRPQAGLATVALQVGLTHPNSGDELITPFAGRLANLSHLGGRLRLAVDDKVAQLSDLAVGTVESPVTYTNSTLPSDIAWDVLTNQGPFSSVQSTSNPDIDYASFSEWAGVFSSDNVEMNAEFNGQKITEIMRKLARYTQSAIYMEGGKMFFSRFTAVNTETTTIGQDHIVGDPNVRVDMFELVTKQTVLADYDTSSRAWGIETFNISSKESVSYGLREQIEKDQNVWYTSSVSALNLAQRFTLIGGNPYEQVYSTTNLTPLPRQVGETINYSDPQTGLSKGYRIMEMEFDLDNGTFQIGINASQTETPFILDESELDGAAKLL